MSRYLVALCLWVLLSAQYAGALERQSNADYRARRERLAKQLDGGTLILFESTEAAGANALNGYFPDKNFYYLTGFADPGAALVISAEAPAAGSNAARPYTEILYLPQRNRGQERWTGAKLTTDSPDVHERTGFARVEPLDKMRADLVAILPAKDQNIYTDIPDLGETSDSASGIEWLQRANAFSVYVTFKDADPLIGDLRKIKDAGEMSLIRKATDASVAAHFAALKAIHDGVPERTIAALMEYEYEKRGCERAAYAPIVGAGKNGTVLHYSQDSGIMKDGDLVLMDVGGEYSMYASDITRTAPVSGKFTPRQRELYDIVLGAQRAAAAALEIGKSTFTRVGENSIYNVAYDYINTHGKDLHGEPLGQYFIHGLSHYIGLDVHDAGTPTAIEPGMVFSIEPGIYIPEEGIGIRIEDDFWVNPEGKLINLDEALPHTADEVEAAMKH